MKKVVSLLLVLIILATTFVSCKGDSTPEHVHTPGAWVTVKAPSCKLGEQTQFCTSCGEVIQTLPIAATGIHNEVIDPEVEATCTSAGLTEGKHCIDCGKIFLAQVTIPKIPHAYDNDKDTDCNSCGFLRDVSCKHTDVTVLPSREATCTENGLTEGKTCNKCEEILQVQQTINAFGHNEIIDEGYEATCTTAGLTEGKHCDRCGEVLVEQSNTKALGHKESTWIIEKEPTETEDGYKYKECITCGEKTAEEVIPFIGDIGLEYSVNSDGKTCTITGIGKFEGAKLDIPDFIKGYKVTVIGQGAFYDCAQLTEINLPETITTIGNLAFYGCTGLTEITIPASVSSIGTEIFANANNLHTVYYNGTYGNGDNNFMNIPSIKKVVFGGAKVPSYILEDCTNVTEVEIKDTVTSIEHYAFDDCDSLTSIVIPDSVTIIAWGAFRLCDSLTSIVIPDSVTSIQFDTFDRCPSLTSITIPNSVKSIERYVFQWCDSLTSINFEGNVKEWQLVTKYTGWDSGTGSYTIYCTDGEITKDGVITYYDNENLE